MRMPQLWVFAGPNGAGKSTLAQRFVQGRVEIVNPDEYAKQINPNHNGNSTIMAQAGRQAIQRRNELLEARQDFSFETTMSGHGEIAFMKKAREAGYKVNLVYVGIKNEAQSQRRVDARVRLGGHPVSERDIQRRFERSMGNLAEAMKIAHRTLVFDNSGKRRRYLLSRENGRTRHVSRNLPEWAKQAIPRSYQRKYDQGLGY